MDALILYKLTAVGISLMSVGGGGSSPIESRDYGIHSVGKFFEQYPMVKIKV